MDRFHFSQAFVPPITACSPTLNTRHSPIPAFSNGAPMARCWCVFVPVLATLGHCPTPCSLSEPAIHNSITGISSCRSKKRSSCESVVEQIIERSGAAAAILHSHVHSIARLGPVTL
jgi:hypothetical protein